MLSFAPLGLAPLASVRRLLWFLFLLVDGLVLFAVAAAYAAAYLSPRTFWWAQLLAIGLPFLALLFAGLTLVPVLAKRWGLLAVHIAVIAILGLRLIPFAQLRPDPPPAPDDLVLMTMNVPRHGPSAERLTADVTALLEEKRPSLVGLQETGSWHLDDPPYRPVIASYVSPAVDSLGYALEIPPDWSTSLPILVRAGAPGDFVVEDQSQTEINEGRGDTGRSRFVRTLFRWHNRAAVHYNIHLRSFGMEKPWDGDVHPLRPRTWVPFLRRYRKVYEQRAREIEQIAERIDAETLPVIISGDFNGTPNNWGYRQLVRDRRDAFRRAGTGWGGTYHAKLPLVRIDYIVVGPEWEVIHAEVPDVRFSDHRPLVARLRWRDEDPAARSR